MANTKEDKNKKPKTHTTPKAEALFVHAGRELPRLPR